MKKLVAIFLLALFLFNVIGYRLLFFYVLQQSDVQLEAALDKELYNESELVAIKIPLSLPYQTDQTSFERVDGEINYNGKIYKYVKRRISAGNLLLLCLPDYNKMRLTKEQDNFFKDANNLAQHSAKKQENQKGSFKNALGDYDYLPCKSPAALFEEPVSRRLSGLDVSFTSVSPASPEHPPELN